MSERKLVAAFVLDTMKFEEFREEEEDFDTEPMLIPMPIITVMSKRTLIN